MTNVLIVWEVSQKQDGSCDIHGWAVASSLSSTSQKGHRRTLCKSTRTAFKLKTVKFVTGLKSNKWPVYCTNCHICSLFVNGLTTINPIHEWDIVAPDFFRQLG